uniref:Uncharacterized protein n=1 Tax=Micrurus lemniscatus lemniscatus TaxID=129467 RepID=A0A2D4HEI6_MICLE
MVDSLFCFVYLMLHHPHMSLPKLRVCIFSSPYQYKSIKAFLACSSHCGMHRQFCWFFSPVGQLSFALKLPLPFSLGSDRTIWILLSKRLSTHYLLEELRFRCLLEQNLIQMLKSLLTNHILSPRS